MPSRGGFAELGAPLASQSMAGGRELEVRRLQVELPGQGSASLLAIYEWQGDSLGLMLCDQQVAAAELIEKLEQPDGSMLALATELGAPLLRPQHAMRLIPLSVPKPWGQEIWYSGIEARGVCAVASETVPCPLPWLHAALPAGFSGWLRQAPVLLKILDPFPEPVLGDLYFELHEVKQEVYVVSHVARQAWPDGIGAIRIGFNRERREAYADEAGFKAAYLQSVKDYRSIRVQIDQWLEDNGLLAGQALSSSEMKAALHAVPAGLQAEEKALRAQMDAFTQLHDLQQGDVVVIPRRLPHALQHGVRSIEFQTPVYERKIVSFAQKVMTQPNWDTEEALASVQMRDYHKPVFERVPDGDCWREKIVDFDDFEVWRCQIPADGCLQLPQEPNYLMLMTVQGQVRLDSNALAAEQAVMLMSCALPAQLHNSGDTVATVLLARPH